MNTPHPLALLRAAASGNAAAAPELAPLRCPVPSVLATERIAHLRLPHEAAALQDLNPSYVADGSWPCKNTLGLGGM